MVGRVLQPPLSRSPLTTSPWGKPTMESLTFVWAGLGWVADSDCERPRRRRWTACPGIVIFEARLFSHPSPATWPPTLERVKKSGVASNPIQRPCLVRPLGT